MRTEVNAEWHVSDWFSIEESAGQECVAFVNRYDPLLEPAYQVWLSSQQLSHKHDDYPGPFPHACTHINMQKCEVTQASSAVVVHNMVQARFKKACLGLCDFIGITPEQASFEVGPTWEQVSLQVLITNLMGRFHCG